MKGEVGDYINLFLAATAWNLDKWLMALFLAHFPAEREIIFE